MTNLYLPDLNIYYKAPSGFYVSHPKMRVYFHYHFLNLLSFRGFLHLPRRCNYYHTFLDILSGSLVYIQNYRIRLKLVGSGYFFQAFDNGKRVGFFSGTSHVTLLSFESTIHWQLVGRKSKILSCWSTNYWNLQQVAFTLLQLRRPDDYKGKGLRYLKQGFRLTKGKKKFV